MNKKIGKKEVGVILIIISYLILLGIIIELVVSKDSDKTSSKGSLKESQKSAQDSLTCDDLKAIKLILQENLPKSPPQEQSKEKKTSEEPLLQTNTGNQLRTNGTTTTPEIPKQEGQQGQDVKAIKVSEEECKEKLLSFQNATNSVFKDGKWGTRTVNMIKCINENYCSKSDVGSLCNNSKLLPVTQENFCKKIDPTQYKDKLEQEGQKCKKSHNDL
jgi:hypothetical protein